MAEATSCCVKITPINLIVIVRRKLLTAIKPMPTLNRKSRNLQ
jgi:hypothetical protein